MTVSVAMSKVPCLNQAMGGGGDVGLDEVGSRPNTFNSAHSYLLLGGNFCFMLRLTGIFKMT